MTSGFKSALSGASFYCLAIVRTLDYCYNNAVISVRRLRNWLFNAIIGLLIPVAVCLIFLPAVFSSRLAVVFSGSMGKAMPVGAVAWMEKVDEEDIKVGDIIAFKQPERTPPVIVSHRVIEVVEEPLSFITKGDANQKEDPAPVPAENVIARIPFSIPRLGYFLALAKRYTRGRIGFAVFIALPTVFIIGGAVNDMIYELNPRKRRLRRRKEMIERRLKRRHAW